MGLPARKMVKLVVRKRLVDSAKAHARSWKIGPRARAPIEVYRDPVAEPARPRGDAAAGGRQDPHQMGNFCARFFVAHVLNLERRSALAGRVRGRSGAAAGGGDGRAEKKDAAAAAGLLGAAELGDQSACVSKKCAIFHLLFLFNINS